ncbi:MAG: hypothetical protein ACRDFB_05250 [Rhabdochlamydiaceae bacterium]
MNHRLGGSYTDRVCVSRLLLATDFTVWKDHFKSSYISMDITVTKHNSPKMILIDDIPNAA